MFEFCAGLVVARWVFGVPMIGSIPLVLAALVYLLVALGVDSGFRDRAYQQQAMFVTFFLLLVYLLMSGLTSSARCRIGLSGWPS